MTVLSIPFDPAPLSLGGREILCLGLGGGSDAVSACLMAKILEDHGASEVRYGNTRARFDDAVTALSPHVGCFEGPVRPLEGRASHGSTQIDRSLPRGPGRSPLVVRLEKEAMAAPETIARLASEIDALGCDLLVGIDTGGDVLETRRAHRNRDRVMMRVLAAARAESLTVVVAPGSDGSRPDALLAHMEAARAAGRYLGCFELSPWRARLEALAAGLPEHRTPRIVLRALASGDESLLVERGARPWVPRALLVRAFVFTGSDAP